RRVEPERPAAAVPVPPEIVQAATDPNLEVEAKSKAPDPAADADVVQEAAREDAARTEEVRAESAQAATEQAQAATEKPRVATYGYGDQPLGVRLSRLSSLSQDQALAYIESKFNAGDLEGAINGAYAWSVQAKGGDNAGFDLLLDRLGEDRDRFDVIVARDRATQVINSGIGGNIRVLNNNGENFGSQIYELQRRIGNDPDNAYTYIQRYLSYINADPLSGVRTIEGGGFKQLVNYMGYGRELEQVNQFAYVKSLQDYADERNMLAKMSTSEKLEWALGRAMDNGAAVGPETGAVLGTWFGAAVLGMVGFRGRVPGVPSFDAIHDAYVEQVIPGAREQTFYVEGSKRVPDNFDPETKVASEMVVAPWSRMSDDAIARVEGRKLGQIGADYELMRRGEY